MYLNNAWIISVLSLCAIIANPGLCYAQTVEPGYQSSVSSQDYDTLYIETFPDMINVRLYLSEKTTNFSLANEANGKALDYVPNTSLNLGIGATAGPFTLNLAYGFPFLNPSEGEGKTRYLDLQSHIYTRKFVIDFFGQFYKGMYLENTSVRIPEYADSYYVRPDISEQIFGLTGLYVFNHKKYSYRASLVQNERQLKSAGSVIAGIEAYYGVVQADSAFVPSVLVNDTSFKNMTGYNRVSFVKAGPSVGYTYTLVYAKHFFVMASLTFNLGMGVNKMHHPKDGTIRDFQTDLGAFGRFALGYNAAKWYLGLSAVSNQIVTSNKSRTFNASYGIGNVRINFVKRFPFSAKMKKKRDKLGW